MGVFLDCKEIIKFGIIEKYVLKTLPEQEKKEFEEHYFLCDDCFAEVSFVQRISEGTNELVESKQIAYEPERTETSIWSLEILITTIREHLTIKWAACALAFAVVFLLIILGKNFLDRTDLDEQRRLFAANSTPSSFMESLIEQPRRAAHVTIVTPSIGFNVHDDLLFSWKRDDESKLSIIILNNLEVELLTFSVTKNNYKFINAADQLPPGLYYWKLEDENEIKYIGKFFVNKPASLKPE